MLILLSHIPTRHSTLRNDPEPLNEPVAFAGLIEEFGVVEVMLEPF